jgi:DNA-directed RNA polymerase subunit RPC12/RpoP
MGLEYREKSGVTGVRVRCYSCGYEPGIYMYKCPSCGKEGHLGVDGDRVRCFSCKQSFNADTGVCKNCGIRLALKNVPSYDDDHTTKGKNQKDGCYIATAVYGSYDAPQVMKLRRFRDNTLANSLIGRMFIKTYYRLSPPIANRLKNMKSLNNFVRRILDRFIVHLDKHDK